MNQSYQNNDKSKINAISIIAFILNIVVSSFLSLTNDVTYILILFLLSALCLSWLFTTKNMIWGILASFIGWAVALIITSPFRSVKAAIAVPCALAYSLVHRKRLTRSGAVGISSAILTTSTLAYLCALVVIRTEALTVDSIIDAFPLIFNEVSEILYDSFEITIAGKTIPLISPIDVRSYLATIIAIFPGALSAIYSLICYLFGWMYNSFIKATTSFAAAESQWKIIPSIVTTVFYILSLTVTALAPHTNIVAISALNIALIFFPTFFVSGVTSAFEPIDTNGFKRPRILRPLILIIAFFNDLLIFALTSTFFGVYDSIKNTFKKSKPENQR